MPNIQRSPPVPTKKGSNQGQSHSSPNVASSANKTDGENITVRSKRQRPDDSPQQPGKTTYLPCACPDLKEELLEMLNSWKADQNNMLASWKTERDIMLSSLGRDVSELKKQCDDIRKTNLELEKSLNFINKDYEDMKKRVFDLESKKKEDDISFEHIEKQIQDIQLHSRSATIELRNVPSKEHEKHEDLVSIISGVGKAVELEIDTSHLRDIYRLPGKPGSTRSIVAEFNSVSRKLDFLSNVRRFNKEHPTIDKLNTHTIGLPGDKKPIYAAEHLSPSMRKLFYECRQFSKTHKLSCWSLNGKIFIKKNPEDKPTQIKSEKCLSLYFNSN